MQGPRAQGLGTRAKEDGVRIRAQLQGPRAQEERPRFKETSDAKELVLGYMEGFWVLTANSILVHQSFDKLLLIN